MLALLAFTAAATTIGPELVERFRVDAAPSAAQQFAIAGDEVLLARGAVLERRALSDGRITATVKLPCAPVDVAVADGAWAALCADRIVVQTKEGPVVTVVLEAQDPDAAPVVVAIGSFFHVWAVGFADGLMQRGRWDAPGAPARRDEIDLRARPVSIAVSGIDDVTVDLVDGTRHAWGSVMRELPVARPPLIEIYEDAAGARRARVSSDVVMANATRVGTALVASAAPVVDVASAHGALCVRFAAGGLACYGAAQPTPPEIPGRDVPPPDGTPPVAGPPDDEAPDEFEPQLDFGSPGALAAYGSAVLGAGVFVSAPFVMQALSPSLGIGPAFALAGLGAVAGVASFTVVAAAVVIVAGLILAAIPDDPVGDWGACSPLSDVVNDVVSGCLCAVAAVALVVGTVVAAAAFGVAALSVSAMPGIDAALGGRVPSDSFGPTLGGAAAGSVVGWGLGAGISLLTGPLRDEDGDGEPDDDGLAYVLDTTAVLVHVVGGSAVGAAIGYGLARGP